MKDRIIKNSDIRDMYQSANLDVNETYVNVNEKVSQALMKF